MRTKAQIKQEIAEYDAIRHSVCRQLANGMPANRAVTSAHRNACNRLGELRKELHPLEQIREDIRRVKRYIKVSGLEPYETEAGISSP